jgi:transcriptional regulator with PAS, ATPase and Fis domain
MAHAPLLRIDSPWTGGRGEAGRFTEIDGGSPAIRRLKRHMACVASDAYVTVLLTGESGTGKERVARAIHRASSRARGPFVVVDCGSLPATLADDALFGHVRGAFTGALDDRPGPFERAHGGTVLLDEIGDLSVELQVKLLRVVQSRTTQRLGSSSEIRFDARIIAATNVDLEAARARDRFREDLFYRLSGYEITVPSLRQRGPADIETLSAAILRSLAERRGRPAPAIDPAAREHLRQHDWPGNVRELEHTLERMLVAASGAPCLTIAHLPEKMTRRAAHVELPDARPSADVVRDALRRHGFRRAPAAAELRLSRHQLYRLVKAFDIRADGEAS